MNGILTLCKRSDLAHFTLDHCKTWISISFSFSGCYQASRSARFVHHTKRFEIALAYVEWMVVDGARLGVEICVCRTLRLSWVVKVEWSLLDISLIDVVATDDIILGQICLTNDARELLRPSGKVRVDVPLHALLPLALLKRLVLSQEFRVQNVELRPGHLLHSLCIYSQVSFSI